MKLSDGALRICKTRHFNKPKTFMFWCFVDSRQVYVKHPARGAEHISHIFFIHSKA